MNRLRTLVALTALVLASGLSGALLADNALSRRAETPTPLAFRAPSDQLADGGAAAALATSLGVQIQVQSVSINVSASTYSETIGLASGDTSGLTGFTMSWSGSGITPRYALGAATTLQLP